MTHDPLGSEIDVRTVFASRQEGDRYMLIDVREPDERAAARIPDSAHIPLGEIVARTSQTLPAPESLIVVYCSHGERSLFACQILRAMGYPSVWSMAGGLTAWIEAGLPVEREGREAWHARYVRQMTLPEIGVEGQRKLRAGRVLIVGVGGLGSPAALYLAAAGVGTVGLVDFDTVDESNLHRQVIFSTDDVNVEKTASAAQRLHALNPDIDVIAFPEQLTAENAAQIFSEFDLIIDGSDNFDTRYVVNDTARKLGKANVYGSVFRFTGQVSVFGLESGPCYRCLYPEPPPPGEVPSCAESGVLGVLPGVIGTLQATEAIKLLTGIGEPLVGRMLHFDALAMRFDEFVVHRRKDCRICDVDGDARAAG